MALFLHLCDLVNLCEILIWLDSFLASRDECPGSLCHSPCVGVGVLVSVGGVDKNFNLGHNFQTIKDRAFILHMCIPCNKTFHMVS